MIVNVIDAETLEGEKYTGVDIDAFADMLVVSVEGGVFQGTEGELQLCVKNQ